MKLPKFKEIVLLLLIVFAAAFLRFYKLGQVPNGLYVDEAVTGYNAYSILETGKDESGKTFPLAFRFFGSYSPPLYTYLTAVSLKLFGLNILSVRFFSAVFGVLGVFLIYFFFKGRVGLIAAFLMAVSPWAIFFSRAGYEINLGFVIFSLGVLFLWVGLTKPKFLLYAYPILSLATYGAHSERYLVPILILAFLIVFKKYSRWGLIAALLIQIPNLYLLTTPAFLTKGGLFYRELLALQSEKIVFLPQFIAYPLTFFREFLARYLTYFSPRTLFFLEDPDLQRSAPELAPFYFWLVIPYLVGLYQLFVARKKLLGKFLLFLLIIFPLPLALTKDPFSSQRGLHFLLPLSLVMAVGLDYLFLKFRNFATWGFFIFNILSLIFLWRSYFILLPYERARIWGYGFSQLTEEIQERPNEKFVIDQSRIKPAYIELAFFLKYPPAELHQAVDPKIRENYYSEINFESFYRFANLETRNIDWEKDIFQEQILVGDELAISPQQAKEHFLTRVFEIRDPVGYIVFRGFKTNPKLKWAATKNY